MNARWALIRKNDKANLSPQVQRSPERTKHDLSHICVSKETEIIAVLRSEEITKWRREIVKLVH